MEANRMGGFIGDSSSSGTALDERLARQLKRKKVGITGFGDYSRYSNQLEYSDSEFSEGENTAGDEYVEEDGVDPDYKLFLENVKADGTSYVLTLPINKFETLTIKYEAHDSSDEPPSRKKSRQVPDKRKTEAARDHGNMLKKEKNCGEKNQMYVAGMMTRSKMEKLKLEENFKPQPEAYVSSRAVSHQKPTSKGEHMVKAECHREKESDVVDATYKTLLNNIKEEGNSMFLEMEGCELLRYEADDYLSDSEVLVGDNISDFKKGNYNPFESSRNYNPLMVGDMQQHLGITHTGSYSEYREKLMDKLTKPYDHNEYEMLMKLIKERKRKSARHIDLRGSAALTSHLTDEPSRSYLEQYSDLDEKIDAVKRDRRKVLNLLRGFFFWLENVAHEDSFRPWLDPSCSEAMPKIPRRIKPCP